jgi:MFS family permease
MFFRRKNKELNAIYTMHSIQGFALSLIGIFIPIYLLILGYSISQVLVFFIIYYLAGLIAAFAAIYIASKIGLRQTLIFRLPFTFVFFILLYLLDSAHIPLGIIAFFGGWQNTLYWIPVHILFTRSAKQKNIGASTGKLFAFPKIASMAGPLLGGFIATFFGFKILISVVFIILLISAFPLLLSGSKRATFSFSGHPFALPQLATLASNLYYNITDALLIKTSFKFKPAQGLKLLKK